MRKRVNRNQVLAKKRNTALTGPHIAQLVNLFPSHSIKQASACALSIRLKQALVIKNLLKHVYPKNMLTQFLQLRGWSGPWWDQTKLWPHSKQILLSHFAQWVKIRPKITQKFIKKRAQPLLVLIVLLVQGAETPYFIGENASKR